MRPKNILKTVVIGTIFCTTAPLLGKTISAEEHFFLKKISEFCKDQDYSLTKAEILNFLKNHPETQIKDSLYAALGDLYFHERLFLEALGCYQAISNPTLIEKTLYKHTQSLYQMKDLQGVINLTLPFFTASKKTHIDFKDDVQFLLASCLFQKWKECSDTQEKHTLAEEAKKLYQTLSLNTHKDLALRPLAELHRTLLEYPQATALYLTLAEKNPKEAEDLFLTAAALQLSFDKSGAINSYKRAYLLEGPKKEAAAYNCLSLLFQEKRYEDITTTEKELSSYLNKEHEPLLQFCLGYSHFQQGNISAAKETLEKYAFLSSENTYKQRALELLIACAQKENEPDLFQRCVQEMVSTFPHEEKTAESLLLHADFAKTQGDITGAINDLKTLEALFPMSSNIAQITYQKGVLLSEQKKWEESRTSFKLFIEKFPQDSRIDNAWGYILHTFTEELKFSPLEARQVLETAFVEDLEKALCRPTFFSPEQQEDYQYLLAKTLFDLKKYPQAIEAAQKLHSERFTTKKHLLSALGYRQLPSQEENFIFHAEQILQLDPLSSEADALELELFNTCIAMQKWDKAATHLYTYAIEKENGVKPENILWLANYYHQAALKDPLYKEKASSLFQKALNIDIKENGYLLSSLQPAYEVEILKWAELLEKEESLQLLTSLVEEQKKRPEAGWRLQRHTLFTLATLYADQKESAKALELYNQLIEKNPLTVSYFSAAARLEKCRLFLHSPKEMAKVAQPEMSEILDSLKELQMQKQLHFEPLHLEAALEYADLRASLASEEEKKETTLFFLKRMQEDFLNTSDEAAEEYHHLKKQLPEKEVLFQTYLNCVQAEILFLEGKKEEALELFHHLKASNNLTPFLLERVENNLKALQS